MTTCSRCLNVCTRKKTINRRCYENSAATMNQNHASRFPVDEDARRVEFLAREIGALGFRTGVSRSVVSIVFIVDGVCGFLVCATTCTACRRSCSIVDGV